MPSLTLKDIPARVHKALKKRAREKGRSLNREALAILTASVQASPSDTRFLLAEIRRHRQSLPGQLNEDLLRRARNTGRP
jgi:plasmid stability protein